MSLLYDDAEENVLLLTHYVLGSFINEKGYDVSMYIFVFIVICRL